MAAVLSFTILLATSALAQQFNPVNVARQGTSSTPATTTPAAPQTSAAPTTTPAPTTTAAAGESALPLTDYTYTYPNLPYQVKFVSHFLYFRATDREFSVLILPAVDRNRGTISVIVPPRALTQNARPCLLTALPVRQFFMHPIPFV
jgi:hypothetical protein